MSQQQHYAAPGVMNLQMGNLSLNGGTISDVDWISSFLVKKGKPGPLTENDFIGAPDQMAVLRATLALGLHLPEIELRGLHIVASNLNAHRSFWDFYQGYFKEFPNLDLEHVRGACMLFEALVSDFTIRSFVPVSERKSWKAEHHLAYYLLSCWRIICWRCKRNGLISWNNNVRLQVMFGLLGLFLRLTETGIIGPDFGRFLKNRRAHEQHFENFHHQIFSFKSDFDVTPLIEELEERDPEGHVAFFEVYLKLLGTNDWDFKGADKRYGFEVQAVPVNPGTNETPYIRSEYDDGLDLDMNELPEAFDS